MSKFKQGNVDIDSGKKIIFGDDTEQTTAGVTDGDTLVVADHGTAATDQVVNVCYGTGSPPTASDTTEGALFIKYTA